MLLALGVALALQDPAAVDRAALQGISSGVFPAAVVVVGTSEHILLARGYGHFTWNPQSRVPHADSSLFDLASVTKVVATTTAALVLANRGQLDLQQPVQRYLPEFAGPGKAQVTVRHLLEHRSGLPAFLRLDTLARDAASARRIVLTEPLRQTPGMRTVYSDLNAMLLGWVVEAVSGTPLDTFATREIFQPLGLQRTQYRPARSLRPWIAPVGLWRGHAIAGEVHDQNAARLGGVSGHAGLYSSGLDLARFAQFMLRRGKTRDGRVLARAGLVDAFVRRGPENRALGWEMRDTTTTENTGAHLSPATYGHTGFTGTSLWIDPVQDVFVIVLTNRVFAPRTPRSLTRLKEVRGAVADAAVALVRACGHRADGCPDVATH
jgi:CubicO group peptidase (beta-lactamase class C family)